jgi:hypoxanthine phosphoribosyltransferase
MKRDIERVLVDEDVIHRRVEYIAKKFQQECIDNDVTNLTVVILLKGALLFAADFVRHLDMKIQVECINASSYNGGTESSGVVALDHTPDVLNKDILLIDDILDTGLTMRTVRQTLLDAGAASVTTCVLLDKQVSDERCDITGFDIPNEFVVGYGLDYEGHYRNLPYVGVLNPSCINTN